MNKKDTLKVINFAADYENNITKIWHLASDGKKVRFEFFIKPINTRCNYTL